ncbi:unnamed protein product, partial [Prorocentrum cordatum]
MGDMSSRSLGEVLTITGKDFVSILQQDLFLSSLALNYADSLCHLTKLQSKEDVSDLVLPVSHNEVVTLMPSDTRFAMSKAALDLADRRNLLGSRRRTAMSEARRHECDMVVRSTLRAWNAPLEECVVKIAPVVSLRLEHE